MRTGLMILLALALAGCGKPEASAPAAAAAGNKALQAAVCPTSPPNCFQQDKDYVGIDVEIFNAFCESRGATVEITAYDWAGMLGAVVATRADVAFSGISITDKRKEVMDFSAPYMVNTLIIAALADRNVAIASTADWKNYKLGFVRGMYFGDLIKTTYQDAYAYADLQQHPSYNELLADLGNGNVDGAFMDSLVMADQKEKGIYNLVTAFTLAEADNFGFAFPKGSALRGEFDQFLQEQAAEVQAIIARHMKK